MSARNMKKPSKTDWRRIDRMTDADIDTSDIPPLSESFFSRAVLRKPRRPVKVSLSVDPDTWAWFKAQGPGYARRANAALRIYAQAHRG